VYARFVLWKVVQLLAVMGARGGDVCRYGGGAGSFFKQPPVKGEN